MARLWHIDTRRAMLSPNDRVLARLDTKPRAFNTVNSPSGRPKINPTAGDVENLPYTTCSCSDAAQDVALVAGYQRTSAAATRKLGDVPESLSTSPGIRRRYGGMCSF